MEKQALKEYKLKQNNNVTEMNKQIYQIDEEELERREQEIEDEEYNMNNIPDDDDVIVIMNMIKYILKYYLKTFYGNNIL